MSTRGPESADALERERRALRFSSRFAVQLALGRHPVLPITPILPAVSYKPLVGPFGDVFDGHPLVMGISG